jgi:choline dehydrogenase
VLDNYEYIIVGSGAGGGPLAARLAVNGAKVLLLEAGDDQGTSLQESIPGFFAAASEYAPMHWDFFVRHYPDDAREALNSKATYTTPSGGEYIGLDPPAGSTLKGIWYPRGATLGGCAALNALETVYPLEEDWTFIEAITGDRSWSPDNMRRYWERLERNEYLNSTGRDAAGHGFNGWLGTSEMDFSLIDNDPQLLAMITAAKTVVDGKTAANITNASGLAAAFPLDMNTAYPNRDSTQSLYRMPMAVSGGVRSSPRDFLLATANAVNADGSKKYKLDIRLNAFVTKVRFVNDATTGTPKAVGVDFTDGQSMYSADPRHNSTTTGTPGQVNATKEVIISAGAFNTPQILKLSGVGPKAELQKFNIPVVVDLPGVGTNLEDHYEISTVIKFDQSHPFKLLSKCTFLTPGTTDACYAQYASGSSNRGPYATNLLPVTGITKSSVAGSKRDTFIFGAPIFFRGYYQGYTQATADTMHWTWAILKSYTNNRDGGVTLKSANPFDTPNINFNFFDAGTTILGADELDIQPLVEGIALTRNIYNTLPATYQGTFAEVYPGANITAKEDVETFVRNEAWSHHATSTASIGADWDRYAVLDSNFRVRGVKGLRVVDASALPRVPGFFPVTSVYMIGEKAADVILAEG